MQYDANELDVFDISRNLSWPLLLASSLLLFTMMSQRSSQIEAVNFEIWSSTNISRIFN